MQTKIVLSLLLSCFLFSAEAQFPGGFGKSKGPTIKGTIKGKLLDSQTNEPIPYATIALKKAGKEKIIDGVLSEEDGSFRLKGVLNGEYDMTISFLGYEELELSNIKVSLKKPTSDLRSIPLESSSIILDEVEITEKRSLVESKVDKIVYNAEDDASISGGDATEVLRKVPMLSVDLDGNVSMRGSQNVKILINGKPSGMFSNNVADALKMFPADEIKKVEVITSPGAKYDAEGSGGIINIITKRSDLEGIAGAVNGSAGTRQNSLFLNLNAGRGRFGFSTNGSMFYSIPADATTSFYREDQTGVGLRTITQDGVTETSRLGFRGTASAFYDFNAYNSLNASFNTRGYSFDRDGFTEVFTDPVSTFSDTYRRDNVTNTLTSGYDFELDYTRKFEKNETQEFSMAFQLSGNIQDQDYEVTEIYELDFLNRDEIIFNNGDNMEATFQLDYVQPVASKNKLEMGAKAVIRNIDSDYQYEFFNPLTNNYELDNSRSNLFLYDQDVFASYLSYNYFIGKFNLVTGLRYEHTTIGGDYQNGESVFTNKYDNFLPNIAISRPLKNFRNLKLSYNQRIQRPSLFYINPFNNNVDRVNQTVGNPELNPEKTHQLELAYNFRFIGFSIFSSAFYRITEDEIEQVLRINDQGLSINTYQNVGTSKSLGINIFTSKSIGRLTLRVGGDVYSYRVNGVIDDQELSSDFINYRVFSGGDFAITGDFKADFFGFFNSPRRTLQGSNPSFSMYGIGLRKDFKNSSIGLRLIEPFTANKNFDSNLEGTNFIQRSSFSIPFRSIGVNFRYKFGKVDFKERKKKIRNEDMKQGQGDVEGGGTQGNNRG